MVIRKYMGYCKLKGCEPVSLTISVNTLALLYEELGIAPEEKFEALLGTKLKIIPNIDEIYIKFGRS